MKLVALVSALILFPVTGCGGAPSPEGAGQPGAVGDATARPAAPTPLEEVQSRCARLMSSAAGLPSVELDLDDFSGEGGRGTASLGTGDEIVAVRAEQMGESGRWTIESYYAGGAPVCSTVVHTHYVPRPGEEDNTLGDPGQVETIRRYYAGGQLLAIEVDDEPVALGEVESYLTDSAAEYLDAARAQVRQGRPTP